MIHIQPRISQEQRDNIEKLADYVTELPADYKHFEMCSYHGGGLTPEKIPLRKKSCATVACFAGHGPYAGIPGGDIHEWSFYTSVKFGGGSDSSFINGEWNVSEGDHTVFEWLFSPCWDEVDPTPHGAALRAYYMLKHGVPENYDDQMEGKAPLCYLENFWD